MLCLLLLPSGDLLSGSGDCTIKVWSLATGKCTATIQAHSDSVRCGAGRWGMGWGRCVVDEQSQGRC